MWQAGLTRGAFEVARVDKEVGDGVAVSGNGPLS